MQGAVACGQRYKTCPQNTFSTADLLGTFLPLKTDNNQRNRQTMKGQREVGPQLDTGKGSCDYRSVSVKVVVAAAELVAG